jgi:hypothetical protein
MVKKCLMVRPDSPILTATGREKPMLNCEKPIDYWRYSGDYYFSLMIIK